MYVIAILTLIIEPGERDVIILRHNIGIQWPDNKTVIHPIIFLFFNLFFKLNPK